jgi:hypothetical protein
MIENAFLRIWHILLILLLGSRETLKWNPPLHSILSRKKGEPKSITSVRSWHKTRLFYPPIKNQHVISKQKTQMLLKHRIKENDPPIFHENLVLPHFPLKHVGHGGGSATPKSAEPPPGQMGWPATPLWLKRGSSATPTSFFFFFFLKEKRP